MAEKCKVILFDLDGTVSDPRLGIVNSVQYALEKMNLPKVSGEEIISYIGPPIQDTFSALFNLDEAETGRMLGYYREYFKKSGMYENELYPGMADLLKDLSKVYEVGAATSKPTVFAEQILRHFGIEQYFSQIAGSNLDGTRIDKGEIIAYAMEYWPDCVPGDFIMVGDRRHDIVGAEANGIEAVGVTYGFGSEEEITEAAPAYTAKSTADLRRLFFSEAGNDSLHSASRV